MVDMETLRVLCTAKDTLPKCQLCGDLARYFLRFLLDLLFLHQTRFYCYTSTIHLSVIY